MIDLSERLLPLSKVAEHLPPGPGGKKLSYPTIWRWALRGIIAQDGERIRLETTQIGGRRMTSLEAIERWMARLAPTESAKPLQAGRRHRNYHQAAQELEQLGM